MQVLPHKHNFSAAMHGWGIFPNNKSSSKLEKNMCKTDLFYQNKHDHQFFLQNFSQVFEKCHKIRSFESSFECTFKCTKGCTFESYGYSKHIFR